MSSFIAVVSTDFFRPKYEADPKRDNVICVTNMKKTSGNMQFECELLECTNQNNFTKD